MQHFPSICDTNNDNSFDIMLCTKLPDALPALVLNWIRRLIFIKIFCQRHCAIEIWKIFPAGFTHVLFIHVLPSVFLVKFVAFGEFQQTIYIQMYFTAISHQAIAAANRFDNCQFMGANFMAKRFSCVQCSSKLSRKYT